MTGLEDFVDTSSTEQLHVMQVEYEEKWGEPIVHLWCRDRDGEKRWVEVEGHRPSFYIHKDAFSARIKNHDWVRNVEDGHSSIQGEPLVKVETQLPKHVGGGRDIGKPLRDYFERTWEADVWYANRFLIDTGIKTHFEVDTEDTWDTQSVEGDYRVHVDDLEPVEDPDWRAEPRMLTVDIEVLSPDGFPDAEDAAQPVTAITAHDSETDGYTVWVLRYEGWAYSDTEIENLAIDNRPDDIDLGDDGDVSVPIEDVRVFENESQMLHDFNEYVGERSPDLLSGWNSSATDNGDAFDYPYLINRCKRLNTHSFDKWSPLGQVWTSRRGTGELRPGAKGVGFFDLLQSYKKTRWSKPKGGYSLENIADLELPLSEGKLDIEDIDTAWAEDPATFLEYNIRDVQATVGIDRAGGVTELYQNLRALSGAQFGDCHNNIDLLDVFILRYAKEMGVALPTNEKPERGWYYGAHVFEPKLGRHENVVYPDLWSMYPNMIRNANMSPETLIGTKEDLEASEYTEEDCRWTYIDTRPTNVKKEADPEYEKLYFVKPDVQQGFMSAVVDDLMELKDAYDGTPLYDAVKRVVNSVYGVYGDSDSYGKGYRLFDWRIAEGITLGGRKMIQDSQERFITAVNNIKDERGFDGNKAYLVGGDTDSVMTSIPFMDADGKADYEDIVEVAHEAAERTNEWYDEWTAETFNLTEGEHYCELEIESYAPRAFIPEGITKEKAKKRYAEIIAWDEGDWELGDDTIPQWLRERYDGPLTEGEFSVTGIDVVRSDRAVATRETVQKVLQAILRVDERADAKGVVYDIINDTVDDIRDGERPPSFIARPKGMSKHPEEYGSPSKRPMPTYRGAKYAHEHFDWENLVNADKPQLLYIERVRGDWPYKYDARTAEDGDEVDAIAVTQPDKVPDEFVIDTDKMIEKVLEDPLTPILAPMRWDFEDALADTTQGNLASFM